jgi:hypothetical protein
MGRRGRAQSARERTAPNPECCIQGGAAWFTLDLNELSPLQAGSELPPATQEHQRNAAAPSHTSCSWHSAVLFRGQPVHVRTERRLFRLGIHPSRRYRRRADGALPLAVSHHRQSPWGWRWRGVVVETPGPATPRSTSVTVGQPSRLGPGCPRTLASSPAPPGFPRLCPAKRRAKSRSRAGLNRYTGLGSVQAATSSDVQRVEVGRA